MNVPTWLRRLAYLLQQSRHDAELREEMEAHRALRAEQLEREGLSAREAADASRRAIGNVLLARDDARDVWLGSWGTWWQDARYGLRTFRRNPAFTAAAVLTLALGIGVNAGIFSVINALLFRDLTAPDAHELVSISQTVQGVPGFAGQDTFTTSEYAGYRERAQTLSSLMAFGPARGEGTLGSDPPRKVLGTLVSCNFDTVLQQPPAVGRPFASHDCEPGAELVVMLTYELWQTAFAGDPGIVGRTIQLNRQRVTVAGVSAPGAFSGSSVVGGGYFAPINAGARLADDGRYEDERMPWLSLLGRRRSNVRLEQVAAELDVIAAQLDQQQAGRSTTLTLSRARAAMPQQLRGRAMGAASVLMGAFALILLIACANVANLLLARGHARTREIAVRASLGASRGRLVRQLVIESLLLSLAGGLLGSLVALWSFQTIVALAVPALLPPWFPLVISLNVSPDAAVVAFAVALTVATGMLFGVAPALHVSRPNLHATMKPDSASAGGDRHGRRLRGALVGAQVALCMVLMMAAGLLLRGLHATYTIDPGFEYRNVALISLESAFDGYTSEEAEAKRLRLVTALQTLPGVEAIASSDHKPLGDDMSPTMIRLPGENERQSRTGEITAVSEDYFSVLGLPIVRGRAFTTEEVRAPELAAAPDAASSARLRPAILSETTARNLWPGGDPIGRMFVSAPPGGTPPEEILHVVGVVADAQLSALGQIDPYSVYAPGNGAALLIKGRAGMSTTLASIQAAVRAVDPTLLLTVLPLEATLGWSRAISSTVTALFAGLGVLALILASVGIYGVVAFTVSRRGREIGVRPALGATTRGVLTMILRQTMRPVIVGAAIGITTATAISRVLSSVLFGVSPADPLGLGGSALLVLGVALTAGVLAARPATRADPTATLRSE